jgi:hypothetical protein
MSVFIHRVGILGRRIVLRAAEIVTSDDLGIREGAAAETGMCIIYSGVADCYGRPCPE